MARTKPKHLSTNNGLDFSFLGSKDESADQRTVESRRRLRAMMSSQMEEFLKKGGKIQVVSANTTAPAPNKPESNYGNRPI